MFTGIIEEIGVIDSVKSQNASIRLGIECRGIMGDIGLGDSIAVNGVCLTVATYSSRIFMADIMPETIRKTSLEDLKIGSMVNLERALRLSDRLGGHIVSGHIDGTGTIFKKSEEGNAIWLGIRAKPEILKYIIPKGSVALDGVSLTVAHIDDESFGISLVPHTAKSTTLSSKNIGEKINIECDMLGKYIERLLLFENTKKSAAEKTLTMDTLKESGFI